MMNEDVFGNAVAQDVLLRDKFLEPPFSVLDTKGGAWQQRKRAWKALGIESHLGREGVVVINNSFDGDKYGRTAMPEVSIFDPALCELMYNWYCPPGGKILDLFAGGSVRGIVANYLGFKYTGIDIRREQVASNVEQAARLLPADNQPQWLVGDSDIMLSVLKKGTYQKQYTPVWLCDGIWVKRDDAYQVAGVNGGKVRTCLALAHGAKGLVTAGSRKSPQINIVASIAKMLGIPCVAHCPQGELGEELEYAKAKGATIVQHPAGYNSVIIARARQCAAELGYKEIPFGMMCEDAITQTRAQVYPGMGEIKRLVIPVGSGMSLAGVLWGLIDTDQKIPVLGVVVGANPEKVLNHFGPANWREMVTLVPAGVDYHVEVPAMIEDIHLDPIYEGKCKKFLEPGDLFWIVGAREATAKHNSQEGLQMVNVPGAREPLTDELFDMLFTCPPYSDLEKYSDLPGDLSNMDYDKFVATYTKIIYKASNLLKPGGYAVWVVGDIRDKAGYYRDFIGDTKRAFMSCGMGLYNDAVLLQPLGTAMLRAAKIFEAGKKLTKVHENVLIFKKP